MHPILFEIGPLKLYTYGLMMALAFIAAIRWSIKRAPRYGISETWVSNLAVVVVGAGILGGRIGHFIFEESLSDMFSLKFFEVWTGGMVFYGGFLAAVLGSWIYARRSGYEFIPVADTVAPTLALAHAIGRVGCFFAGCCYGKECHLPWALTFTNPKGLAPLHIPLHPTQIYEILGNLMIVGIIMLSEKWLRFKGQTFAIYLALYAILRMAIEGYRGDADRGFIEFGGLYPNEWLSTSTLISIVIFAAGVLIFVKYRKVPPVRASS